MAGIGVGELSVFGSSQVDFIFPCQVPFRFGNGTSHFLNILNFQPHFTNNPTKNTSNVTTFGNKLKKSMAFDRSNPYKIEKANHKIPDTISKVKITDFKLRFSIVLSKTDVIPGGGDELV